MLIKVGFSDQEIIENIRKGNKSALVQLYKSSKKVIKNLILKNNGMPEDAEDILQETLIIVWQNVNKDNFSLSSKLNTYVYSIAQNLWFKQFKNKQKFQNKDIDDLSFNISIDSTNELYNEKQNIEIIAKCMNALGDTCKELLGLFYFDGWNLERIAEKLQFANIETVKARKYQCKKKLEEIVKAKYSKSDIQY